MPANFCSYINRLDLCLVSSLLENLTSIIHVVASVVAMRCGDTCNQQLGIGMRGLQSGGSWDTKMDPPLSTNELDRIPAEDSFDAADIRTSLPQTSIAAK